MSIRSVRFQCSGCAWKWRFSELVEMECRREDRVWYECPDCHSDDLVEVER